MVISLCLAFVNSSRNGMICLYDGSKGRHNLEPFFVIDCISSKKEKPCWSEWKMTKVASISFSKTWNTANLCTSSVEKWNLHSLIPYETSLFQLFPHVSITIYLVLWHNIEWFQPISIFCDVMVSMTEGTGNLSSQIWFSGDQ